MLLLLLCRHYELCTFSCGLLCVDINNKCVLYPASSLPPNSLLSHTLRYSRRIDMNFHSGYSFFLFHIIFSPSFVHSFFKRRVCRNRYRCNSSSLSLFLFHSYIFFIFIPVWFHFVSLNWENILHWHCIHTTFVKAALESVEEEGCFLYIFFDVLQTQLEKMWSV